MGFMNVCRLICFLVLLTGSAFAHTIAIVMDGEGDWFADAQAEQFQVELNDLLEGQEPATYQLSHGYFDETKIRKALMVALQDPEVDVIYTGGFVGSMIAQRLQDHERNKPVLAGGVRYTSRGNYPISASGGSTIPNFTFIGSPQRVESDLELLTRVSEVKTIYVLAEDRIVKHLPNMGAISQSYEQQMGVQLKFITGRNDPQAILDQLPDDTEAVYVSILGQIRNEERLALYQGLAERKLLNLAMAGERALESGPLLALPPDPRLPIARRPALSLYQLLRGANPAALQVSLPVEDRLRINMETAKAMGWSPGYDLHMEAGQLDMDVLVDAAGLTIEEALDPAAARNVSVRLAEEGLEINRATERQATSGLRPQLELAGDYGKTDITSPIEPMGPTDIEGGSFGAQLTQILFNDTARSSRKAARALTESSESALESTRLDAMEAAGIAFLQLDLARALYNIQKENLRLTDNNLQLARLRNSIGATDNTEVYRWESNAARDRSNVFEQEQSVRNALADLNRIMGSSQNARWNPVSIPASSNEFYFLEEEFGVIPTTEFNFKSFRDYIQMRAMEDSRELQQFDSALEAQGYTLRRTKRQRFLPEIAGVGTWNHVLNETDLSDQEDEQRWFIGLTATLPIFAGGGIRAEVAEQKARMRELETQRHQAAEFIDQQAITVWNNMRTTHPTIRLSRQARHAAQKTYTTVRDKYSHGAASLLDLLDAQAQLLQQEQQAVAARYAYLIHIIQLQRIISWFEYQHSPDEREAWSADFIDYLNTRREAAGKERL